MLRALVTAILRERLPMLPLVFTDEPIFATLVGHHAIGDLTLRDDGDEVTLSIGRLTHHHFNPYDASLDETAAAEWIGAELSQFLESLAADRVLIWRELVGGSGGCRVLEAGEPLPKPGIGVEYFVWSGPVPSYRFNQTEAANPTA
jgi:hypothetical protein